MPQLTPQGLATDGSERCAATPKEGGRVIVIEMTTDEKGVNKFAPNDFEAHEKMSSVFTLGSGVHNVGLPRGSTARWSHP